MRRLLISLSGLALLATACSSASTDTTAANTTTSAETTMVPEKDIVAVASEAGGFTTLLTAAEAAGLVETLQGEGPFTVFAPTDEAFAALPEGTLDDLLADPDALKSVLLYHVVAGQVLAAAVVGLEAATSVQGEDIAITVDGDKVMVNGASVVSTDIPASNGVIHVIDAVILPPSMSEAATMADIVETALAAGDFSTLVAAVEAAGLVDTLRGDGPFTVFAPTDDAFAALPDGTLDDLLADPDALRSILLYHVVAGKVTADMVAGLESADSVEGSAIGIRVDGGKVFVNDAQVTITDILTSNGVIHVIDKVILPPAA
ncbi:MAG TPA: fasciclin domain-containing protein [Thermoleophilia bacterium]|nr:fasciclin domain-containing protein [Thermoleophilia bacterium]